VASDPGVVGDPVEGDDAKDRVEYLGKAVIYGAST
jgi:hypothetical protein